MRTDSHKYLSWLIRLLILLIAVAFTVYLTAKVLHEGLDSVPLGWTLLTTALLYILGYFDRRLGSKRRG